MVRLSIDPVEQSLPKALPKERVDAARNRAKILRAAELLFDERGACSVSMDDIAETAGVGKGTLYRRFHDQAGLALAVLEEKERRLQQAVIRGVPPLGPGAPPKERLVAFLHALLDLLEEHTELHLVSERTPNGTRYHSALYGFYRLHVQLLLGEVDAALATPFMPDAVMSLVSAELFRHLRQDRELPLDFVKAEVLVMIERLCRLSE
jgi:AcrR family transcriptional regulator